MVNLTNTSKTKFKTSCGNPIEVYHYFNILEKKLDHFHEFYKKT
jgi:hypothetical protein